MKKWPIVFPFATALANVAMAAPLLVHNVDARHSISLNGQWSVIVDPYENGYYNHRYEESPNGYFKNHKPQSPSELVEYDFADSQKLQVPGDWNTQDDKLFLYEGTVWYERDFSVKKREAKRYILHFGAVNYSAIVYLNGKKIGMHEGGFTPFQFDVTDLVEDGANFVVVKVDNRRERDQVPTVNTDWWNYGGITRPVKLLEVDSTYIADYSIQYQKTGGGHIQGWLRLAGAAQAGDSVKLSIPELNIDKSLIVDKQGRAEIDIVSTPELWTPDTPKLYRVVWRHGDEQVVDKVGFRSVEVSGEDILLNGKSIFLRGISIHEESPRGDGRAWSEDDARTLLRWAKELGCNYVRLAHYPHNENMLRMADEMGLLVWSEIPVYWTVLFDNDKVYKNAENQLGEMISRDKNHASIILWSIANETPNTPSRFKFLKRLAASARNLDSTRLITAALDTQSTTQFGQRIDDPLAEVVDVIGINSYCGWYSDEPEDCAGYKWESKYRKPVIISEMGAGAKQGYHGSDHQRFTEEYQDRVYKYNLQMLDNMSFLRGVTPWILKDFRSPRRPLPDIQDFWNRKGLVSEVGIKKKAWYTLRDWYRKKQEEFNKK